VPNPQRSFVTAVVDRLACSPAGVEAHAKLGPLAQRTCDGVYPVADVAAGRVGQQTGTHG
jgi:hypothetical protein